jgi:carbamoyl-phosphate synthase large subunit
LITSAGSLVADAIFRCLAEVRAALTIVGVNSLAAPVAFACDRLHRVPPTADAPAYQAALRRVLARERPDLVLPGRDEDLLTLSALAASGDFPETVFPVPPPGLAPVFVDKRQTHRFACAHGLPFAPSAEGPEAAAALAQAHGYPLVAKPWRGAASRGVFLVCDAEALSRASADPELMVQAFLGPEVLDLPLEAFRRLAGRGMPWRWAFEDVETTAELTIAPDGMVATLCLDCGTTAPPLRTAVRLLAEPAVAAVGLAWGQALAARGHRGPVNIQGKRLADGRFVPYEIGARFGGTSVARAMLGHNQVLHLVSAALGWPVPRLTRRPGEVGLQVRRTWVPAEWHRGFEQEGGWRAPSAVGGSGRPVARPGTDAPPATTSPLDSGLPPPAPGPAAWDRLVVAAYARRHGLPFISQAATVDEARTLAADGDRPLIAKPQSGDGPILLLERWEQVVAILNGGGFIVQPALSDGLLAAQRSAWSARIGPPWLWAVADRVETAEADVGPDGLPSPIRTAVCTQQGGQPVAIQPTCDAAIVRIFRCWAEALIRDGYSGPLRITGKRDAKGLWVPFSVRPNRLGLPDGDGLETRTPVPAAVPEVSSSAREGAAAISSLDRLSFSSSRSGRRSA